MNKLSLKYDFKFMENLRFMLNNSEKICVPGYGYCDVEFTKHNVIIYIGKHIYDEDKKKEIAASFVNKFNKYVLIKTKINGYIIPDKFYFNRSGIIAEKEIKKDNQIFIIYQVISNLQLFVTARVYSQYHDIFQFEVESYNPISKKRKVKLCEAESLGKWSKIISFLMNELAVNTEEQHKKDLTRFFNLFIRENFKYIKKKITIPHMGWNDNNTEFFPYSNKLHFDYTGDTSRYLRNTIESFKKKGNLHKYKSKLYEFIENNYDAEFVISTAFTAPLLKLIGVRSFAINFYGESGSLKSLSSYFGMSAFGDPMKISSSGGDTKLVLLEKLSKFHNLPFYIDEIKRESLDIYGIGNESGRHRLNKAGQILEAVTWRTIAITTSEISMENDSNKKGEVNRVICTNVDCTPKILKNKDDLAKEEYARNLYLLIGSNYGLLGEKYIRAVINDKDKINNYYKIILDNIFDKTKQKQHIYMIAAIALGNYLFKKNIFNIDNIDDSIRLGKYFVKKLSHKKDLDPTLKMLDCIYQFYEINKAAFRNESEIFNNNYCYGAVRDDKIIFILNPLKEYLEKQGFNWNEKKSLIDLKMIEYKSAKISGENQKRIILNINYNENNETDQEGTDSNFSLPAPKNIEYKKFHIGKATLINGDIYLETKDININEDNFNNLKGLVFINDDSEVYIPKEFSLGIQEYLEKNLWWRGERIFNVGDNYLKIMKEKKSMLLRV